MSVAGRMRSLWNFPRLTGDRRTRDWEKLPERISHQISQSCSHTKLKLHDQIEVTLRKFPNFACFTLQGQLTHASIISQGQFHHSLVASNQCRESGTSSFEWPYWSIRVDNILKLRSRKEQTLRLLPGKCLITQFLKALEHLQPSFKTSFEFLKLNHFLYFI